MTTQSAIARSAAVSVESKLTGHAKRADGGLNLRFMIHPNDIPQQLRDAPIGTRYLIALVEIGDDEQPVLHASGGAREGSDVRNADDVAPSRSHKPVAPEKRLAQRAGILCNDPLFRKFLMAQYDLVYCTDEGAAEMVRQICKVESRSELVPGTAAGNRWDILESAFVCWRDEPDMVQA